MTKQQRIFIGILVLALASRLYKLDTYAPYIDEKFTLLTSNGICVGGRNQEDVFFSKKYFTPKEFWKYKHYADYEEAIARAEIGAHLPYNFALHAWSSVWGLSDFSQRIFSAILGFLTIILVYFFVKDVLKSPNLALVAAFLATIEPMFLALNHMIRSYSLSLFLTLSSTYLFFKLLQAKDDKKIIYLYFLYFLVTTIALLTHFLNGMVLLIQGLYVLCYVRDWNKWLKIGISAGLSIGILLLWFMYGGGQWTFQFMADKNVLHSQIAKLPANQNPLSGTVDYPTWQNLYLHLSEVISDFFLTTNGLYAKLKGTKNFIVFFVSILASIFIYQKVAEKYKYWAIYGVSLIAFLLYSTAKIDYLILSANVFMLALYVGRLQTTESKSKKRFFIFLLFFCIVPQVYLCFDAIKSGHTGSITQRYGAFAMHYSVILVAILVENLWYYANFIRVPIFSILVIQMFFVLKIDMKIFDDTSAKYTYFENPRTRNPYKIVSELIIQNYAEGDTIVYPSNNKNVYSTVLKEQKTLNISDAQYTNIYLPKNADFIQKIDVYEVDKVKIIKRDGSSMLIFDFEGTKYRY